MPDSCLNSRIASEQNAPGEAAPSQEKQSGPAAKGKVDKEREASLLVRHLTICYVERFHTGLTLKVIDFKNKTIVQQLQ